MTKPFIPKVYRAGDGTTLVQIEPEAVRITTPEDTFVIVHKGPVFRRLNATRGRTAMTRLQIRTMSAEGAVVFTELRAEWK